MKKVAWMVLIVFVGIMVAGCLVARPAVAPPPPRKEVVKPKPGSDYVWISGHWKWSGQRYVWVSGHWTRARKGHTWIPGHWQKRGRHWVYVKGHWRRR